MSRISKTVAVLITFACLSAVTAAGMSATAAEGTPYRLDELGLTVSVPDDFTVLTRGADPGNPAIALFGLDAKSLDEYFISNKLYLAAIPADGASEILVNMIDNSTGRSYPDFRLYSEDALRRNNGDVIAEFKNNGFVDAAVDVYSTAQEKYVKLNFSRTADQMTSYVEMYDTVVSGKLITLSLVSIGQPLTETQHDSLKRVVDSLVFDKTPVDFISGSLSHGLYIFGFNLASVLLTGAVGIVAAGLVFLIFGRKRTASRTPPAPPVAPSSGRAYTTPPYSGASTTSTYGDKPVVRQLMCPNCFATNWDNSTRCAECGVSLERGPLR